MTLDLSFTVTFTLELPVWKLQTVCVSVRAHACVGERKRDGGGAGECMCVRACMYFGSVCNTALSQLQLERHSPLSVALSLNVVNTDHSHY